MIKLGSLFKRGFSFNQHTRHYGGHKALIAKGIKNPLVFRNLRYALHHHIVWPSFTPTRSTLSLRAQPTRSCEMAPSVALVL